MPRARLPSARPTRRGRLRQVLAGAALALAAVAPARAGPTTKEATFTSGIKNGWAEEIGLG